MKKLVLIITMFVALIANKSSYAQGCLEMDILLVVDFSGSVKGHEVSILDALQVFTNRFELDESKIRIGIIVFHNFPMVFSNLTGDKKQINEALFKIKNIVVNKNNYTNINQALIASRLEFKKSERIGVKKRIILISDGAANVEKSETIDVALELSEIDIYICGIYINSKTGEEEFLQKISLYCYYSTDYEHLAFTLAGLDPCS